MVAPLAALDPVYIQFVAAPCITSADLVSPNIVCTPLAACMSYMTTLLTMSYQNSQCFTRKMSRTTLRIITNGRYFRISACRTSTTLWQAQTDHWQQKRLHTAIPELVYGLASIMFHS